MVHKDYLSVALIQTNHDHTLSWSESPRMSNSQQILLWEQIQNAFRSIKNMEAMPEIVLLPELAVPLARVKDMNRYAKSLNCAIAFGYDYVLEYLTKDIHIVKNKGKIIVPDAWLDKNKSSRYVHAYEFGKTYPAASEKSMLNNCGWDYVGDSSLYLYETETIGKIAICICYDLMDVERHFIYRGKIQTLFVLSYNQDATTFYSLAESLARTLFCNVVICNTGFHGGSFAIAPYYTPYKRTIYKHEGKQMLTTQIIKLPIKQLVEAQNGIKVMDQETKKPLFKSLPPGHRRSKTI